ncbi:MAG: UDP-glucose/GDP-mannose dehydrogenase family protein [Acidimicrobiia bacterium]|nr:UDP-glucose/GDP-mannose dehydrogenase family protein [Acidimicrobiia bacterium]
MTNESTATSAAGGLDVAVIGTGYVGTVAAVAFATLGHRVVGIESDPAKLAALRAGSVPFFEPGLGEFLTEAVGSGRLTFTDDLAAGVAPADVVFICVQTPPGEDGRPDLTALRDASMAVAAAATGRTVVITKSTVPIGWGAELRRIVGAVGSAADTAVVSNPEFLREGSAVNDFLYPDRVVLGGEGPAELAVVTELYRPIIEQSFPAGRPELEPVMVVTDTATAETIKYAANGFLATKIAFINEIARICDQAGADVLTVADAMGLDHRIERRFLGAGIGYGGSCFSKDLEALSWFGDDHRIDLPILGSVNRSNAAQRATVVDKLRTGLGNLSGRRIALLGLAYKADTDDLRDAPAITIARSAIDDGATVTAYDPVVRTVAALPDVTIADDAYEAVAGADAVVLVTEWREFADLDLAAVAAVMAGDLVVDGRNWLDPLKVTAVGLRYVGMGRSAAAG